MNTDSSIICCFLVVIFLEVKKEIICIYVKRKKMLSTRNTNRKHTETLQFSINKRNLTFVKLNTKFKCSYGRTDLNHSIK